MDLKEQTIALTYQDLLKIDNSGSGLDSLLRYVTDGGGQVLPIKISDSELLFLGLTTVNDQMYINKSLYVKNDASVEDNLSVGSDVVVSGGLLVKDTTELLKGLSVKEDVSIEGDTTVSGSSFINNNLSVGENFSLSGDMEVEGESSFLGDSLFKQRVVIEGAAEIIESLLMRGDINSNLHKVMNLNTPTLPKDAANKDYVDYRDLHVIDYSDTRNEELQDYVDEQDVLVKQYADEQDILDRRYTDSNISNVMSYVQDRFADVDSMLAYIANEVSPSGLAGYDESYVGSGVITVVDIVPSVDDPLPDDGIATVGVSEAYARADHSHPLSPFYSLSGHIHEDYELQLAALEDTISGVLIPYVNNLDTTISGLENTITGLDTEIETTVSGFEAFMDATVSGISEQFDTTISGIREELYATISGYREDLETTVSGFENLIEVTTSGFQADLEITTSGFELYTQNLYEQFEATASGIAAEFEVTTSGLKVYVDEELASYHDELDAKVEEFNTTVSGYKDAVDVTIAGLEDYINATVSGSNAYVDDAIDDITDVLNTTVSGFETYVDAEVSGMRVYVDNEIEQMETVVSGLEVYVEATVSGMLDYLDTSVDMIQAYIGVTASGLDQEVEDLRDYVDTTVSGMEEDMATLSGYVHETVDEVNNTIAALVDHVDVVLDTVDSTLSGFYTTLSGFSTSGHLEPIINDLEDFVYTSVSGLEEYVDNELDLMKGTVNSTVTSLRDYVDVTMDTTVSGIYMTVDSTISSLIDYVDTEMEATSSGLYNYVDVEIDVLEVAIADIASDVSLLTTDLENYVDTTLSGINIGTVLTTSGYQMIYGEKWFRGGSACIALGNDQHNQQELIRFGKDMDVDSYLVYDPNYYGDSNTEVFRFMAGKWAGQPYESICIQAETDDGRNATVLARNRDEIDGVAEIGAMTNSSDVNFDSARGIFLYTKGNTWNIYQRSGDTTRVIFEGDFDTNMVSVVSVSDPGTLLKVDAFGRLVPAIANVDYVKPDMLVTHSGAGLMTAADKMKLDLIQ